MTATTLQLLGAGCFGAVVGWYVYYINRYRKGDVQLSDIVTLLGTIGGSAVLGLFEKKTDLFGAYGVGLAIGFFGYFLLLVILVGASSAQSRNFNVDWFLDGRRKEPEAPWSYPGGGSGPTQRAMDASQAGVGRDPAGRG